jgi:hypothetical protein
MWVATLIMLVGVAYLVTARIREAAGRSSGAADAEIIVKRTLDAMSDRIGALEQKAAAMKTIVSRTESEVKGALGSLSAIKRAEKRKTADAIEEEIVDSLPSEINDSPVDRLKNRLRRR